MQPPRAGTPTRPADVQGIYRSIRQGTLQLRGNGEIVLVVPDDEGISRGSYSLQDGTLTVRTPPCGPIVGEYRMTVTGEQKAGKATLRITAVHDECEPRRRHLTIDPWVYADS